MVMPRLLLALWKQGWQQRLPQPQPQLQRQRQLMHWLLQLV